MTKTNQKIPVGWSVKKLGEISLLFSGGTPSKEEPLYWTNGHIKWLSARYIEDNKVIGWDYITEEGLEKSSAKLTYANDIILVTRVSVGKIYFCKESYAVNQDLTVIRSKNVNSKFLFFLIKNKQALILEKSQGLAIKGITKEELSNMSFPIPPLAEQKAIAEILSCWDEGIEKLSALIEKKKLQKKALMQKLLTAKIRLPGFTDPWKNVKLGDFLIFQTGFPFDSQFFNQDGNGIRLIKNRDLKSDDQMYFYSGNYSTDDIVNDGDILVGMDGDFLPCLWKKGRALLNQRVGRVICKKNLNHIFAYYALSSPLEKIQNKTASTTVKHLSHAGVLEIKTIIPSSLAEQKAIADILSKADAEIELLNKKLAAFNLEKKAMMQKLLTGQIRVKVN